MKKILLAFVVLASTLCPISAFAAEGSIQVTLPEEMRGTSLNYTKVEEGGDSSYNGSVVIDETGNAKMEHLEEGIYLIEAAEHSEYAVMPSKVSIPLWSEEEKHMLYDVSVIPKFIRNITEEIETPNTGDVSLGMMYGVLIGISFIIVVIISCHNHFICDRMTHEYSR